MSPDRHARPYSTAAAFFLLAGLACGGGGGGGGGQPGVVVSAIDPSSGFSGHQTEVVITGDNFLISPTSSSIRAWLDATELLGVTRDAGDPVHKLHATVPAGLDAGAKTLKVQNAYGSTGSLANAFTVQTTAGAALAIVTPLTLTPGTVNVGQSFTVQVQVKNAGTAAATGVVAALALTSTSGAAGGITAGPDPTSIASLAPGETGTFTWTVDPTAAGTLAIEAKADGQDVFSGKPISADPVSAAETVQQPAGLTATVIASNPRVAGSKAVDVGQAIAVAFSVSNGGMSTADLTTVALSESGTATGTNCTGPTPAMPQSVGAGESRSFAFSCTASGAGTLVIGGNVAGTDHTSHAPLSDSATPDTVTVQTPPVLGASLATNPSVISLGQTVSVVLTIRNTGGASATLTGLPVPTAAVGTDQTKVSCGTPSPSTLATVSGGGTATYSWTCAPIATGTLNLGATVSASDANTLAALPAATAPTVTATVQNPATLVAVTGATPTTVDAALPPPGFAGQTIGVTFDLINGGTATADVTSVVPTAVDPTGAVTATCTAPLRNGQPLPALLQIAAQGAVHLTWTCLPGQMTAGTVTNLVLSGTVAATDHNSGATLSPTISPNTVTVQTPASVTQTAFSANPTTVDTGQASAISLTLRNSGGAAARVTVTPNASPASGVTCTPTPAPSQTIASAGTLPLEWSCTSTAAGVHVYGATVTAQDVNTNLTTAVAVTAPSVTVQTPGQLAVSVAAVPTTANTGQAVTVTATFANAGGTAVTVSALAGTLVPVTGTCGSYSSTLAVPFTVSPGTPVTGTWTCAATTTGAATLGATVTATVTPTITTRALTIQTPAATSLTGALSGVPSTVVANQAVPITFTLTNAAGGATAQVTAISPTISGVAGNCTPVTVTAFNLAGGDPGRVFNWTCTPTAAGTATLGATVTATDLNLGAPSFNPAVPTASATVVVPLTGTLSGSPSTVSAASGGTVTMTLLTLMNQGPVTAHVPANAVTPTATGSAGFSCLSPTSPNTAFDILPGATATLSVSWTCTAPAGGTPGNSSILSATVLATANGVSVNATLNTVTVSLTSP